MPLGRCNACLNPLRFGSRTCARCGAKKQRAKYIFATVVLVQVGAIIWYSNWKSDAMKVVDSVGSGEALDSASPVPPGGWQYYTTRDDLVGDVTQHSRVLSRGVASTGPQDTSTTGVIELRQSTVYGSSMIMTLQRQPFDRVDENCSVHAQFDTGDAVDLHAACSADNDRASIVVTDASPLLAKLASAQTLSVGAALSAKVERTAMFDVAGFKGP